MPGKTDTADDHDDIMYPSTLPFILLHVSSFAAFWTGITWQAVAIGVTLYWLRMFAITAGYHRYFSHRAYSTSRLFQFILRSSRKAPPKRACCGGPPNIATIICIPIRQRTCIRRGTRASSTAISAGFFTGSTILTDLVKVADFSAFPELRWLHRFEATARGDPRRALFSDRGMVRPGGRLSSGARCCFITPPSASIRWRMFTAASATSPATIPATIGWLAFFTMGEGWHNNHHAYQSSARQGFRWWEIDATFYILKALSFAGIVWDLKTPPAEVLRNEQRLGSRVINRAAEQLVARFNPERIALAVSAALHSSELSALREALDSGPASNRRRAGVTASGQDPHPRRIAGAGASHVRAHPLAR